MTENAPKMRKKRRHIAGSIFGTLAVLVVLILIFWSWDWFVPLVNRQASAALQRTTTISHLHVHLGRVTRVTVDDLHIDQPKGFEAEKAPFAEAKHLTVSVDAWGYITHRVLSLPLIALDQPSADIVRRGDGSNNYTLAASSNGAGPSGGSTMPKLGILRIIDGHVAVRDEKLRANMQIGLHTEDPKGENDRGRVFVQADGRYAAQPITALFVGGALLSVLDPAHPYPVDLTVRNGPTEASLKGSLVDAVHFAGAKLALHFAGPDMALLYPLTGIPIPHTPSYSVVGNLDYTRNLIRFSDFHGRLGTSDLGGTISVNPHDTVPYVDADLHSHLVDLADLGGFIGAHPESAKVASQAAAANPGILPNTPINVPKLRSINAHLQYHGDHIENKRMPLDNIDADIAIKDGAIDVKHLNFAVGHGTLASGITLNPVEGGFATKAHVDFARVELARIMQATTDTAARGIIGGHFTLTSTGNSMASLMANGSGGLTLVLDHGGNLNALVPDALGLELGRAILTALGLPSDTDINCFIADMPLRNGVVSTNTLMLDTNEARTLGRGTVDFRTNRIDYSLTTRSQHFSIGSIPGPINISGPLKSPSVLPGAEIIGRAAASVGLGILMPPAALIPTIQFGVGDKSACERSVQAANDNPAAGIAPGALTRPAGAVGKGAALARPVSTASAGKAHGNGTSMRGAAGSGTSGGAPGSRAPAAKPAAPHAATHGKTTLDPAAVRAAWAAKMKAAH